jgi:cadmium resistance protein CadD (predicted permease)
MNLLSLPVLTLPELQSALGTSVSAFCASNLDDIVLLLFFFSSTGQQHRPVHVVAGQYLGFALLVLASLVGFVGGQIVPTPWIGLLGLLPISLGVSRMIDSLDPTAHDGKPEASASSALTHPSSRSWLGRWRLPWPQVFAIAAVTVANGGDNVGLYMPLFAHCTPGQLLITLAVFFVMVGLWCALAWQLVQTPGLAQLLSQYGQQLVPFVLIGLGALILIDSHTLQHRGLATLALTGIGVMALSLMRQLQQQLDPLPMISRSRP